jgi:hypothetical protein
MQSTLLLELIILSVNTPLPSPVTQAPQGIPWPITADEILVPMILITIFIQLTVLQSIMVDGGMQIVTTQISMVSMEQIVLRELCGIITSQFTMKVLAPVK